MNVHPLVWAEDVGGSEISALSKCSGSFHLVYGACGLIIHAFDKCERSFSMSRIGHDGKGHSSPLNILGHPPSRASEMVVGSSIPSSRKCGYSSYRADGGGLGNLTSMQRSVILYLEHRIWWWARGFMFSEYTEVRHLYLEHNGESSSFPAWYKYINHPLTDQDDTSLSGLEFSCILKMQNARSSIHAF